MNLFCKQSVDAKKEPTGGTAFTISFENNNVKRIPSNKGRSKKKKSSKKPTATKSMVSLASYNKKGFYTINNYIFKYIFMMYIIFIHIFVYYILKYITFIKVLILTYH